ncbi:MAG: hypothetical protein JRF25_10315 [Deltaproteobacteria bacterium]|nr:hypothetical protein [Deltaproteobacteria bacterium]
MVRIKDTMSLEYLVASRALENEISSDRGLKQITPWAPLTFNESKNLTDLAIDRTVG